MIALTDFQMSEQLSVVHTGFASRADLGGICLNRWDRVSRELFLVVFDGLCTGLVATSFPASRDGHGAKGKGACEGEGGSLRGGGCNARPWCIHQPS